MDLAQQEQTDITIEDFIKYCNDTYNIEIKAIEADIPDTFEKIFGGDNHVQNNSTFNSTFN